MSTTTNASNTMKARRQALWRIQRQWIGLILIGLVLAAAIAAVYLNISAHAALAGRDIQILQEEMEIKRRENADLETKLASLTSIETMRQRAEEMGFQPVSQDNITYLFISGYAGEQPINLASNSTTQPEPVILPEYTESLLDWFTRNMLASSPLVNVQP